MKKIIILTFLILTFFAGAYAGAPAQDEPAIIVKSSCLQGDVIFVTIDGRNNNLTGEVFFLENEYKMFNTRVYGNTPLQVILPIPVNAKAGKAEIKFSFNPGAVKVTKAITIKPKKFPAQYLSLPKVQKQNYHSKAKDDTDEILDAKIMTCTGKKLWSGNFAPPCKGATVTLLGTQRYHNGEYYNFHKGVDVAAPAGAPVYAPGAGKVVFTKNIPVVYGKTIVLDHGCGITSLYLHLSKIEVKENQEVKKGQLIGRVGSTGTAASGPHLHWGMFVFGEAVEAQCFYNLPEEFR